MTEASTAQGVEARQLRMRTNAPGAMRDASNPLVRAIVWMLRCLDVPMFGCLDLFWRNSPEPGAMTGK